MESDGWVNISEEFEGFTHKEVQAYPAAIYYMIATVTTVGYGEFYPGTNLEYMLIMFLEL